MSPASLIRWSALGAVLSGVAWIVIGLTGLLIDTYASSTEGSPALLFRGQPNAFALEKWPSLFFSGVVLSGIASIGMLGGLVGLHALQATTYGRFGKASFLVAFIGSAGVLFTFVILRAFVPGSLLSSSILLQVLLGVSGALAALGPLLGFVLFGIATLRARVLPRWCGVALIIVAIALLLRIIPGARVVLGMAWLAVGYVLWAEGGAPAGLPSHPAGTQSPWQPSRREALRISALFAALAALHLGSAAVMYLNATGYVDPELVGSIILWAFGIVGVLAIVITLIRVGYRYEWTGFSDAVHQETNAQEARRAKTLWDWLGLLIIPAVLAVGGLLFSLAQDDRQQRTEEQRAQDVALQTYLDEVGGLLLDEKLLPEEPDDQARTLARARTLTVLERLDLNRKRSVLRFLYESNLIGKEDPVVNVEGAELREGNLDGIDLTEASLRGIDLRETNLRNADLTGADLSGAGLSSAVLRNADLDRADLSEVPLIGADLSYADLREASLEGAHLGDANLTGADLSGTDLQNLAGPPISQEQIESAYGDQTTQLPGYLQRPEAWQ